MTDLMDHLLTRRTVPSADLGLPVPDESQMETILTAAFRVPDHKAMKPWRIIRFSAAGCEAMNKAIETRFRALNPDAHPKALAVEQTRFSRAPMVVAVISSPGDPERAPLWEQYLSAGAVCTNLIHACYAAGFSAQWLSEWYAYDPIILAELGVSDGEQVAGFIHIGTPTIIPVERPRPDLSEFVSIWEG